MRRTAPGLASMRSEHVAMARRVVETSASSKHARLRPNAISARPTATTGHARRTVATTLSVQASRRFLMTDSALPATALRAAMTSIAVVVVRCVWAGHASRVRTIRSVQAASAPPTAPALRRRPSRTSIGLEVRRTTAHEQHPARPSSGHCPCSLFGRISSLKAAAMLVLAHSTSSVLVGSWAGVARNQCWIGMTTVPSSSSKER